MILRVLSMRLKLTRVLFHELGKPSKGQVQAVRNVEGVRPRKTMTTDDRYIIVKVKRERKRRRNQTADSIEQQLGARYLGLLGSNAFIKVAYSPIVPNIAYH